MKVDVSLSLGGMSRGSLVLLATGWCADKAETECCMNKDTTMQMNVYIQIWSIESICVDLCPQLVQVESMTQCEVQEIYSNTEVRKRLCREVLTTVAFFMVMPHEQLDLVFDLK